MVSIRIEPDEDPMSVVPSGILHLLGKIILILKYMDSSAKIDSNQFTRVVIIRKNGHGKFVTRRVDCIGPKIITVCACYASDFLCLKEGTSKTTTGVKIGGI